MLWKKKRLAKLSTKRYYERLAPFGTFLEQHPEFGKVPTDVALRAMPLAVLEEYFDELIARGLKPNTLRSHEITVKELCKWLALKHSGPARDSDPYLGVKFITPTPPPLPPRHVTVAEVLLLLKNLYWEDQRAVTHFIFDTGVRISEVERFTLSDLPDPANYPSDSMYFPLFVRGSKGSRDSIKFRWTIISRAMLSRLNRYHNSTHYLSCAAHYKLDSKSQDPPLFFNTEGTPLTSNAIEKFIEDGYKRGNLPKVSAHRLRHGTGFSVLKSEHGRELLDNLIVLQKMLGHEQLSTTQIYTRMPAAALRRNVLNTADKDIRFRFEESQQLFDETYLPAKKHKARNNLIKRRWK